MFLRVGSKCAAGCGNLYSTFMLQHIVTLSSDVAVGNQTWCYSIAYSK